MIAQKEIEVAQKKIADDKLTIKVDKKVENAKMEKSNQIKKDMNLKQ